MQYQQQQQQHQQQEDFHQEGADDQQFSSDAGSEQELAQQMLMQEQFAAYEHHLQMQNGHQHQGSEDQMEEPNLEQHAYEDEELSQSDFLGSNQEDEEEMMEGDVDEAQYQRQMEEAEQHRIQLEYFRQRQEQLDREESSEAEEEGQSQGVDEQQHYMGHQQHENMMEQDEEIQEQTEVDTDRLRQLQQHLHQNQNQGPHQYSQDESEEQSQDASGVYEPVGRQDHPHRQEDSHQRENNQLPPGFDGFAGNTQQRTNGNDLSGQIGNCDLSNIEPNTLTSNLHALNSNLHSDVAFHLAASNAIDRHPNQLEGTDQVNVAAFPQKSQQFQNVAQFLKQQREEERLAEEKEHMGQQIAGGDYRNDGNMRAVDEGSPEQEDDEDGDDDTEIQEMKAKFNQILANFEGEQQHEQVEQHRQQPQHNSNQGTGYFKGGVPQELQAMTLSSQRQQQQQQVIGTSSNELTMQAVTSSAIAQLDNNNNGTDAIESYKQRNRERNLKGDQVQQNSKGQIRDEEKQQEEEYRGEEIEDHEHAIENYENIGDVLNLQIGGDRNQDFFFRQEKGASTGKPPMPGKQFQQRRNTNNAAGSTNNGHTPERAGMMRPPRTNEFKQTTQSTYASSNTANSRPMTEKQKVAAAAQMRQNALQYGNSRRSFNLKSNSNSKFESNRPRSSQQPKDRSRQKGGSSISHSHSERIFFPLNGGQDVSQSQNQRSQRTLQNQRPQTAKASSHLSKQRSQHEVQTADQFHTQQPPPSAKPAFITSSTPRGMTLAGQHQHAESLQQMPIQSSYHKDGGLTLGSHQVTGPSNKVLASSSSQQMTRQRPQTAKYQPYAQSLIKSTPATRQGGVKGVPPKKKNDPVSRYQSMQNEWSKNNFLKKTTGGNGRKLELDRFNQWRKLADDENKRVQPKKTGTVHKVLAANKHAKALGSDRRDDLRYALRAKISQKDYVDKEMKHYHYGKAGVIANGQLMMNGAPAGALSQQQQNGYGSSGMDPRVQGADVATQIAAAQHMLMLQQKHAQQVEMEQLSELRRLEAEKDAMIMQHQAQYDNY